MKHREYPDNRKLYRLPWSTNDNPIGWVEVTDVCNLKCKGCYRMVTDGHKPLEKIKEEILFLKRWRNCDNISLAGGEPILHPDVIEIVRFSSELGMKVVILTNGYALNEKLIADLRDAGLTGFSFHIDSTQLRPEFRKEVIGSEMELTGLRMKYARMVSSVGGVFASFGITVTSKNAPEIRQFAQWAIDNLRIVHGISLITYRGMPVSKGIEYYNIDGKKVDIKPESLGYAVGEEDDDDIGITSKEVYAILKENFPGYEATAYLGGTEDHTSLKWIIGNIIFDSKGKIFGGYGPKSMELIQTFKHYISGNYIVYARKRMGTKVFWLSLFDPVIRKAFRRYLWNGLKNPGNFFRHVRAMGIAIIQAPDILPDGRINMCDDCPDMCVHEGKLVNSCRLDECRFFKGFLHVHITDISAKQKVEKIRSGELVNQD